MTLLTNMELERQKIELTKGEMESAKCFIELAMIQAQKLQLRGLDTELLQSYLGSALNNLPEEWEQHI